MCVCVCVCSSIVQHRYIGAVNLRSRLRGCLCSCGAHVLAGSEDGAIHVWNTDTGVCVHTCMMSMCVRESE